MYIYFQEENLSMNIVKFRLNDIIELKKEHPCGSKQFKVVRVGSVMRIICLGCSRDMEIDRIKLEKATKKIIFTEEGEGQ